MARKGVKPRNGGRRRQREIHQGTSPATVPGASTRKAAVPKMANTRRVRSSSFRRFVIWICFVLVRSLEGF
jgi:hypothetical protein